MSPTALAVDEGPHSMDGSLLHAWDGSESVEAFMGKRVMQSWVDPIEPYRGREKFTARAIQRPRQAQSRRDRADRRFQVPARRSP